MPLQFNGKEASVFEKSTGSSYVNKLKAERTGAVRIHVVEQGDHDTAAFLQALGAPPGFQVPPAIPPPPAERGIAETKIFLSPSNGQAQLVAAGIGANRSHLKSNGVYVVDQGDEVFVWVGKQAAGTDAKYALQRGIDYLRTAGKPMWCPVHRVTEGTESKEFKALL